MRIIGGEYRARTLKMPGGVKVRPTQDRVREAVFNIIRVRIPGSDVLDLYAGSGAFGIEALSRGAHSAVFVDNNTNCIKTIKSNLSILTSVRPTRSDNRPDLVGRTTGGQRQYAQVLKRDAIRAISRFKRENKKFDIIFLDPPYHRQAAENSLIKIDACDILTHHGFVIAEHFIKDVMPRKAGRLLVFNEKKYGDTVISFYRE